MRKALKKGFLIFENLSPDANHERKTMLAHVCGCVCASARELLFVFTSRSLSALFVCGRSLKIWLINQEVWRFSIITRFVNTHHHHHFKTESFSLLAATQNKTTSANFQEDLILVLEMTQRGQVANVTTVLLPPCAH